MRVEADDAQVKGYTYLSYVTPLKRERSALWSRVEEHLPDDSREFFAGSIFANNWYTRKHLHALMQAFQAAVHGDVNEVRELGAMAARVQLHMIYRLFLKFATPALVFNRATSVWSRQSNVGRFVVVEEADDHLIGELEDPDLPVGIPDLIAGWSDTIIAMLGRTPFPTSYEKVTPIRWRFKVSWVTR
jgi:hypothetical protein